MKLFPQCLLLLLLLPVSAQSATLRVPAEYATINAGLDAAVVGDTVLVAPGTYTDFDTRFELFGYTSAVAFLKGGVVLLSEAGPDQTMLRLEATHGSPCVVSARLQTEEVRISGFTITSSLPNANGVGFTWNERSIIENCVLRDLKRVALGSSNGHMEVYGCEFLNIRSEAGGALTASSGDFLVEDCRFENCSDKGAMQIWLGLETQPTTLVLRRSTFIGNTKSNGGGAGCAAHGDGVLVEDCWFEGNRTLSSGGGGGLAAGVGYPGGVTVRNCTFVDNHVIGNGIGGGASVSGHRIEVTRNTFFGNSQGWPLDGGAGVAIYGDALTFAGNVLASNIGPAAVRGSIDTQSSCNVYWSNSGEAATGFTLGLTDVIADPEFCDPFTNDFRVSENSPCMPGTWVSPCDTIGAHGAGCAAVDGVLIGVTTIPSGLDLTVDGEALSRPRLFRWASGTEHVLTVRSVLGDGTPKRYDFSGWMDGESDTSRAIVVPAVSTTFAAEYDSLFYLTTGVTVPPEGWVSPPSGYHASFDSVVVTAFADSGFYFERWYSSGEGGYTGVDSVGVVVMLGPISQHASFTKDTEVTLTTDPTGFPVFTTSGYHETPVTFIWNRGSNYLIGTDELFEDPGVGTRHRFASWSDGGALSHIITVPHDPITFTAAFSPEHLLSFEPTAQGTTSPGDGWWQEGASVQITATPAEYYLFSNWVGSGGGSYSGPDNPASVVMEGPVHQEARFHRMAQEVSLSLSASDPFLHTAAPIGLGYVYVWYVCATVGGFSRLDAELTGTMDVYAFLPEPGVVNEGSGPLLEIVALECRSGPTLLGAILVQDDGGGELSLVPRSDTGLLGSYDCSSPQALVFEWPLDLKITNVRTDGGAAESSGRGCEEEAPTAVQDVPPAQQAVPSALSLSAPRPNPLQGAGRSRFEFALPGPATVRLAVYDVTGRQVAERRPEVYPSGGAYRIDWDPGLHSSGVYYVRLTTDAGQAVGTRWVVVR